MAFLLVNKMCGLIIQPEEGDEKGLKGIGQENLWGIARMELKKSELLL